MINNKLYLKVILIIYYLAFPIFVGLQLYLNLSAGKYPSDADSIIIPFAAAIIVWILGFVPFGFVLWAVSKTDLQDLSFFEFNKQRFALSTLISIIAVLFVFFGLGIVYNGIYYAEPLTVIYLLAGIYIVLCLRVVFMYVGRTYEPKPIDDFGLRL